MGRNRSSKLSKVLQQRNPHPRELYATQGGFFQLYSWYRYSVLYIAFFFSLLSSSGRIPMVKHVVLHWWCSSGPGVDKTTEYIMEPRLLWDHWEADLSHSILCCSKHNSYYRRKHLKLDGSLLYFLWICDLLQQSWNNETSFAFVYYCFDRQVSSGPISSLTPSTEPENITNYDQVYAMMTSFYTM